MKYQYVDGDTNTTEKKMRPLTFGDLKAGDLFSDGHYGYLYIKCVERETTFGSTLNATCLDDGKLYVIAEDQNVDLYNGVVTLNTDDFVSEIEDKKWIDVVLTTSMKKKNI